MNNRVYIASIKSIFPRGYHPDIAVDALYPANEAGEKLNLYVKRVAKSLGFEKRYSVLDADLTEWLSSKRTFRHNLENKTPFAPHKEYVLNQIDRKISSLDNAAKVRKLFLQ